MNILLDYFFPITTIEPTPAASTAFLKQVLAIVKPKSGATEDVITLCTSKTAVDAFSDTNAEVDELFDAGMSRVYVTAVDDLLEIDDIIAGHESDFHTILITSDFTDAEMDARVIGGIFKGVIGMASTDDAKNTTRAALANTCAFHSDSTSKAKNMFYAFGKLLSNAGSWLNQQYITMPRANDVATLGAATALFDDKVSFVLADTEFGPRLGLFCAGGKAITAPYIKKNLEIDLQSAALQYVSGNQPEYTKKQAALLEDELQKVVQEDYIDEGLIEAGTVEVTLEEDNFVASGAINISEPKALWRIVGEIRQTL
jgi:hypothetical protein